MKNIIILIIAVILIVIGVSFVKGKEEEKSQEDYKKIEALQVACEEIANSSYVNTLGNDRAKWYIFELEYIHQATNDAQAELETILGEDFKTSLSNGDSLFVGFLPYLGSYRIYAGGPTDENMIYPDWNYKEVLPVK